MGSDYESLSSEGMYSTPKLSNSTPLKPNSRPGHVSANTADERSRIKLPDEDKDFLDKFFDCLPEGLKGKNNTSISQLLGCIASESKEENTYIHFDKILNSFALDVAKNSSPAHPPLHFHLSPNRSPAGEQKKPPRPDILVFPQKDKHSLERGPDLHYEQPPWFILEAIVEVKAQRDWFNTQLQVLDYLERILQHRPDKTSVLGMFCDRSNFGFFYMDACTQKRSATFQWDENLDEVIRFVYSLHHIYQEERHRDQSMTLYHAVWDHKCPRPVWHIEESGQIYEVQPMFQRKGPGRRTWLGVGRQLHAKNTNQDSNVELATCIIKDIWKDNSRRYVEGDLLEKHIHNNRVVPGVVRHTPMAYNKGLTSGYRTKHRLIMRSLGSPLSSCPSVLEFLKVMYDVIETHENLLFLEDEKGQIENQVLHRDISWFNVLRNPQHYGGHDTSAIYKSNCIQKVLGEANAVPLCLLADFDNAALLCDTESPDSNLLTQRTGTPMFTAVELAYSRGFYIYVSTTPITQQQLLLEGEAYSHYIGTYGEKRYNEFNTYITSALSESHAENSPPSLGNSVHSAHHDIESVYWIIVWFFLRAWPADASPVEGSIYRGLIKSLLDRHFDSKDDRVGNILAYDVPRWILVLPSPCHSLANMLADMSQYISMRWFKYPNMPVWHAHEAFKRLMLKEIIRMTNNKQPILIQGVQPRFPAGPQESNLGPTGSGNTSKSATHSHHSKKGARSHSEHPVSENEPKRPRRNPLREASRASKENSLVQACLQDLEFDAKWFA